jgi:rhamnosyltransferase
MVSSGLRKDVWAQRGFREDLQYAEDDEYTRWCRTQGYTVTYVPESVVMHSHNYTPAQARKRSFGDARAIGKAWTGAPSEFNWLKTVALGWLSDLRHDLKYCFRTGRLAELPHAAFVRWHQRCGKLAGFRQGRREAQGGAA